MITIPEIRKRENQIIVYGNHEPIIQSILDFDYYSGKTASSITAIVTGRRGFAKYFWGRNEILLPTLAALSNLASLPLSKNINLWTLNLLSGRRTLSSTLELTKYNSILSVPAAKIVGSTLFAENVPERDAQHLIQLSDTNQLLLLGPASVGLVVPGKLKLGPIGGITPTQILETKLIESGHVAVLSASGGMTNELINIAIGSGQKLSFALSFGGDRFPVLSPREAFLLAQSDPHTKAVLYYGELGGNDEYELVKLKEDGKFTKPVIAHIAGTVASLFTESPQFGHAKAKVDKQLNTASAKRHALQQAGFKVSKSFSEFIELVNTLKL